MQKFWAQELCLGLPLLRFLSFVWIFSFFFISCTQKPQPPSSASKVLPQVYFLKDSAIKFWNLPNKSLESSLGIRFIEATVASEAEAREQLLQWSARPLDLLLVAGDKSLAALEKTTLQNKKSLKVLQISETKKSQRFFEIDEKELSHFLKRFCNELCQNKCQILSADPEWKKNYSSPSATKECTVSLGQEVGVNISGDLAGVFISIPWDNVLTPYLRGNTTFSTSNLLKISNASLNVRTSALASDNFKIGFSKFLKSFSLENL